MKKIFFYIAAIALSVGCTKDMVEYIELDGVSSPVETCYVKLNLNIDNVEDVDGVDTRVSITPGERKTDNWKTEWEDGDQVLVWSLDYETFVHLTYVAEGNSGSTFEGEIYPGRNRIVYGGGYAYNSDNTVKYPCFYSLYEISMVSSKVFDLNSDGVINDPDESVWNLETTNEVVDLTMQTVSTAIDFRMKFANLLEFIDLKLTKITIGGLPEGEDVETDEYTDYHYYLFYDPEKDIDDEDFSSDYPEDLSLSIAESYGGIETISTDIPIEDSDTEYSVQFALIPFTIEDGKKLNVTLEFNDGRYEQSFYIVNNTGADFTFERATHNYLEKVYELDLPYSLESLQSDVYSAFRDMDCYHLEEEMIRSDIAVEGGWDAGRSVYNEPSYLQTFDNTEYACSDKWDALYQGVIRTNQLIKYCTTEYATSNEDETDLKMALGEAYFFRAIFQYWLYISYNQGNIPILDETFNEFTSTMSYPEGGAEEVRKFFLADFEKALEYGLPTKWDDDNKERITSGAVKSYIGQSYLYEGDYATAMTYFKEIIDSGQYSLAEVGMNNGTLNEFNSESILEVDYNVVVDGDNSSLANTWHITFGRVGTTYYQVYPAAWFAYMLTYEEEVDQENPNNWVEVDADEDGNIKYTYLGESYDYTTTYSDGTYDINSYVFRKYDEDTQATEIENYGTYSRNIVRVKRSYEADGTTNPDYNTSYNLQAVYGSVIIKEENGVYYRLKTMTPRASHKLAMPQDENVLYYGGYSSYMALYQSGHLGYFKEFTNHDIYTSENDSPAIGYSGVNQRLMTLSDIYLMYAECLVETGGSTQSALDYINKLRYRGGTTLLGTTGEYAGVAGYDGKSYSADDIREQIRFVERPIEVGMGQATRVCDLRRWGITKSRFDELAATTFTYGPFQYVYPATTAYGSSVGYGLATAYRWGAKIYTDDDFAFLQTLNSWLGALYCKDYNSASENYTDAENAYWPIPDGVIIE